MRKLEIQIIIFPSFQHPDKMFFHHLHGRCLFLRLHDINSWVLNTKTVFIILAIYQHMFMLQFVMNMQTLSFHLGGQTEILYQQLRTCCHFYI